jgi:hypothetical protein
MRRADDERVHRLLDALVRHLHGFAREVGLAEAGTAPVSRW